MHLYKLREAMGTKATMNKPLKKKTTVEGATNSQQPPDVLFFRLK